MFTVTILIIAVVAVFLVVAWAIYCENGIKEMNKVHQRQMSEIDRAIKALHDYSTI